MLKSRLEAEHAFAAFSNYSLLIAAVILGSSVDVAKTSIIVFSHLALKGIVRLVISNHILQEGSHKRLRLDAIAFCSILSVAFCTTLFLIPVLKLSPNIFNVMYFCIAIFLSFFGEVLRLIRLSQNLITQSLSIQFFQFLFVICGFMIILVTENQKEKSTFFLFLAGFALSGLAYVLSDNRNKKINSISTNHLSLWSKNFMFSLALSLFSYAPLLIINFLFFNHLASETIDLFQSSNIWFIPLSFLTNVAYIQAVSSPQSETDNVDAFKRFYRWAFLLFLLASIYGFALGKDSAYYFGTFFIAISWIFSFLRQKINIRLVRGFLLPYILVIQVLYVCIAVVFAVMFRGTSNLLSVHLSFFAAEFSALILTRVVSDKVMGKSK